MVLVFKSKHGNYLLTDTDMPVAALPFEEEDLRYITTLNKAPKILYGNPNPRDIHEVGSGYAKHGAYMKHLTPEELREMLKQEINSAESEIVKIKINHKQSIPQLKSEIETLKKIEQSIFSQ